MKYYDHFVVRICPVCGKKFIPAPNHSYKTRRNKSFVCSYGCALADERKIKLKHPHRSIGAKSILK